MRLGRCGRWRLLGRVQTQGLLRAPTAFVTMIELNECWPRRALVSNAGSTCMTNALGKVLTSNRVYAPTSTYLLPYVGARCQKRGARLGFHAEHRECGFSTIN